MNIENKGFQSKVHRGVNLTPRSYAILGLLCGMAIVPASTEVKNGILQTGQNITQESSHLTAPGEWIIKKLGGPAVSTTCSVETHVSVPADGRGIDDAIVNSDGVKREGPTDLGAIRSIVEKLNIQALQDGIQQNEGLLVPNECHEK